MDKNELREHMKTLRDSISKEEKATQDSIIFKKVVNSKYYIEAASLMVYVSFGLEVDTISIIKHALENNKIVCVPKIINKRDGMKAIKIENLDELIKNKFGILEPVSFDKEVCAKNIDLFLVPGLAFDDKGGRIGYGAGYYDRFLREARDKSCKIGLAYNFQVINKVPMTEYDVYLEDVIT
jgi:5-formyltetrahydrofolate cyclo-ligase